MAAVVRCWPGSVTAKATGAVTFRVAPEKGPDVKKIGRKWLLGARDGMVLLAAFAVAGCYPKAGPAPGTVSAQGVARASSRWPGTTAESLSAGHDLFIQNCNRCHDYPDLTAVAEEKWPDILQRMANKAGLSDAQRDLVLHFVLTARSEQSAKQ